MRSGAREDQPLRTILILALLCLAPTAFADPVRVIDAPWATGVCVEPTSWDDPVQAGGCALEQHFHDPACSDDGSWSYHDDSVGAAAADTYVDAGGHQSCSRWGDATSRDDGVQAEAYGPLAGVQFAWFEYAQSNANGDESGCAMVLNVYAVGFGTFQGAPCAAGAPPNPGWGHLLP